MIKVGNTFEPSPIFVGVGLVMESCGNCEGLGYFYDGDDCDLCDGTGWYPVCAWCLEGDDRGITHMCDGCRERAAE